MDFLLDAKQAKNLDIYTIQTIGIPSLVLMERASFLVTQEIQKRYAKNQVVKIFAGTGNNGADGLAVARMLLIQGYEVKIFVVGNLEKGTEEFRTQYNILDNMSAEIEILDTSVRYLEDDSAADDVTEAFELCAKDVVVDGLFGIGLTRNVEGIYRQVIAKINQSDAVTIAIDIPSGLNATTGEVMGICIKADMTVTFGKKKTGHFLCEGKEYCGELVCDEIGYPDIAYRESVPKKSRIYYLEPADFVNLPKRTETSNKGSYGSVSMVGGGALMSGAVILSSQAAYRCGTGLVKIYTGKENLDVVRSNSIESVVHHFDAIYGVNFDKNKDVICIGSGLSVSEETLQILQYVLKVDGKKIIDADALNLMAQNRELLEELNENCILTPHVKEMSRLTGFEVSHIRKNAVKVAKDFSKEYNCITVLKDAGTVIAGPNGEVVVNTSGNSAMSKGGSGDVLAGIISALVSQKMRMFEAAAMGVYLHGLAGDEASKELGQYSVNASNLVDCIYKVFTKYNR